jgi:hypothetical protein
MEGGKTHVYVADLFYKSGPPVQLLVNDELSHSSFRSDRRQAPVNQ